MIQIQQGDAMQLMKELPDESVNCIVTSPPYWGLRSYLPKDHPLKPLELGQEKTPEEYTAKLVDLFREVRRALAKDGTFWLNISDSYSSGGRKTQVAPTLRTQARDSASGKHANLNGLCCHPGSPDNCKPKDLVGIPWLVAFALRADGWYLRSEITWCKKAPMPESVTDRPATATEKIFLFTKSPKYWYDTAAVRNPLSESFLNDPRWQTGSTPENEKNGYDEAGAQNPKKLHRMFDKKAKPFGNGSTLKNFWLLGPQPCREAHFATMPEEVARRCVLLGCPVDGTVLDPFGGSGTTGRVSLENKRKAILFELNPDYLPMIESRTTVQIPLIA